MKKQLLSFYYAVRGIINTVISEAHMRFHIVAAVYVIGFAAVFYNLSKGQWSVLVLTICAVFVCEIFNTAAERLCDCVTKEKNSNIAFVKDCCAGAVLVSAIAAVCIAFFIFWRPDVFHAIFGFFRYNPLYLVCFILSGIVAVWFIATGFMSKSKRKDSKKRR